MKKFLLLILVALTGCGFSQTNTELEKLNDNIGEEKNAQGIVVQEGLKAKFDSFNGKLDVLNKKLDKLEYIQMLIETLEGFNKNFEKTGDLKGSLDQLNDRLMSLEKMYRRWLGIPDEGK